LPPSRGGPKKKIESLPHLHETFQEVLQPHTAGNPEREQLRWTNLSRQEIAERLQQRGFAVSTRIVEQLLDEHDYHRRQLFKTVAMGQAQQRNEQFEYIADAKQQALASGLPVLSVDTKKRELIGPFYRYGWLYSQQRLRVYDHDFPSYAEGVVIPHGLYDLRYNRGYLHLGTSRDTSEFACDCLERWWDNHGRLLYPHAVEITLLCDGGGSNNVRTYLFKADLQQLADRLGKVFRVLHYPPYCSKWNPIEHRLFPHVSRACRGMVFDSLATVKTLMERTQTRTGLRVEVEIVDKVYQVGRKVADEVKETLNIVRDPFLPLLNYRIKPGAA
jgi:Rhodopirellula transposase DDE domain